MSFMGTLMSLMGAGMSFMGALMSFMGAEISFMGAFISFVIGLMSFMGGVVSFMDEFMIFTGGGIWLGNGFVGFVSRGIWPEARREGTRSLCARRPIGDLVRPGAASNLGVPVCVNHYEIGPPSLACLVEQRTPPTFGGYRAEASSTPST
jgi:hypothetical protein